MLACSSQRNQQLNLTKGVVEMPPLLESESERAKGFQSFQKIVQKAFDKGAPKEKKIEGDSHAVKIRTTPVVWGVPCDEVMFSKFFVYFVKHANFMPWDSWATTEGTYLGKARNEIHGRDVRKNTKVPYLMMLDSDIVFPPNLLETLMAHDLPIVGGWYKDKHAADHQPTVYDFLEDTPDGVSHWKYRNDPGEGLEKVDAMGAGCWLMKREVAEALGEEPYETFGGGEDMKLCRKLMKLGIPLHVDWSINLAHVGVFHV